MSKNKEEVIITANDMGKESPQHSGIVSRTVGTGGVIYIEVIDGGSNYEKPGFLTFSGGGGSGANASFTINSKKQVESVTINSSGSGYIKAPTVKAANSKKVSTATFKVTMGSKCGQVKYETLVAM